MKRKIINLLIVCLLQCGRGDILAQTASMRDEFNGPFKSWANVKQRFNAKGDGRIDDTKSLQEAFDGMTDERFGINSTTGNAYSVVYLPRGIYRVTKPLYLTKKVGFIIVGEDPENTIILYDGANNGTIIYNNGSSYFQISRIQFRTNNKSDITGIGIHWGTEMNSSNSYAPQGMEISDCIFRNGFARGIAGGSFGKVQQDATNSEVSIRNCHFYQCTDAAIMISGYNALNYWVWNCRFYQCKVGVHNRFGNSYVYRSYFKGSTKSDVFNHHGYYSSIRGCYSDSSKYFYLDDGYSCNPFKRVLEANVVKNSGDFPIEYSDFGFITLLNNYFFRNANKEFTISANIVTRNSICKPDEYKVFSIGNYFEYPVPFRINKQLLSNHKYSVGDYGFGKQKPNLDEKSMLAEILLPFTKKVQRKVFEIPSGASREEIQVVINEASSTTWRGKRPVVHLPWGKYNIERPLVIPAGSDIKMTGDGFLRATVLKATPTLNDNYFILVKGPSYVTIENLQIGWETGKKDNQSGIKFDNIDQQNARVFIDQIKAPWSTQALLVNSLTNTYVQKTNSYYAYRDEIIGSPLHATGKATSTVNLFGGQPGFFSVKNYGKYFVKDTWFEGTVKEGIPFRVTGNGTIVIDCARLGVYDRGPSYPVLEATNFTGKFLLMNSYVDNTILVDNKSAAGTMMFINLQMNFDPIVKANGPKNNRMLNMSGIASDQQKKTVNDLGEPTNIKSLMKELTGLTKDILPRYYTNLPNGISNVWFSRISFGNVRTAISLNP